MINVLASVRMTIIPGTRTIIGTALQQKGKTMIKVENIEVWGFEHAIRGMRNPKNSWEKSDSYHACNGSRIGENDIGLMRNLYKGGPEHRKFMRQIFVSMDIVAPLYWWKEFDTYKVGTTADSCSTMHKIHAKEFVLDDFSHEHLGTAERAMLGNVIELLNVNRDLFNDEKDKTYWWHMIQLLPSSYNQRRTVTMNYENAVNMIRQREFHKLDEWREFVRILKGLPYIAEITGENNG